MVNKYMWATGIAAATAVLIGVSYAYLWTPHRAVKWLPSGSLYKEYRTGDIRTDRYFLRATLNERQFVDFIVSMGLGNPIQVDLHDLEDDLPDSWRDAGLPEHVEVFPSLPNTDQYEYAFYHNGSLYYGASGD